MRLERSSLDREMLAYLGSGAVGRDECEYLDMTESSWFLCFGCTPLPPKSHIQWHGSFW